MRVALLSLALSLLAALHASALEIEDQRSFEASEGGGAQRLRIISTGDIEVFAPTIRAFQQRHAQIALDYVVVSSTELARVIEDGGETFDLALSSAMDLQVKLANDGLARPYRSSVTRSLPAWARWRDRVFAFTHEPATVIVSPDAFGADIPRTRQELIERLRAEPERFREKVGTYDIRTSGLGFLFATQDARASDTYWRLMEVFGALDVRLYCCSGAMIEDVASGRLLVAYNALGNYVPRDRAGEVLVIEPRDFTTVMMRTAILPGSEDALERAGLFLDFLLERAWDGGSASFAGEPNAGDARKPIPLGPGLLVFLDRFKKRLFLREWESAIEQ